MAKQSERTHAAGRRRLPVRTQVLIAILTAVLGFAIAVQLRHTESDEIASLRQDDLVRLLDEITRRNEELTSEGAQLRADRNRLQSGTDQEAALEEFARMQRIVAGLEPVEGPGVRVIVSDRDGGVPAQAMVHMLEELRNAGAEAVEINGVRLGTGSYFIDEGDAISVDGQVLEQPYTWRVIGNSSTLLGALDIPGGALASFRNAGALVVADAQDIVQIESVRRPATPEYAELDPDG